MLHNEAITAVAPMDEAEDGPIETGQTPYSWRTTLFLLCYSVFMLGIILYNGQLLKFAGNGIFVLLNHSVYFFGAISIIIGILFGEIVAVIAALSFYLFFLVFQLIGAKLSPLGFSNNIMLVFSSILYTPLISFLFRRGFFRPFYIATAMIVTIYCLTYDFVSLFFHASAEFRTSGSGFIAASGDRGARIFLDGAASTICLFLGLSGLKSRSNVLTSTLMVAASVAALYLSASRTLEARTVLLSLIYLAVGVNSYVQRTAQLIVLLSFVVFVAYFFGPSGGNVYHDLGGGDLSVMARATELENARSWIMDNPLLGLGFVNPAKIVGGQGMFDLAKDVLWNDLGIYGVIYATGFFGVLVYLVMNMMIVSSRNAFTQIGMPKTIQDGLVMAGIGIALTSVSITTVWDCGLELFSMVLAARVVALARPRGLS